MNTKDRIMEASYQLFLKKGLDNVSLNEIKKVADITSGGFYHYFESKEELIAAVERNYILKHYSDAVAAIKKTEGNFVEKIRMMVAYTIGFDPDYKEVKDSHNQVDRDIYFLYLDCVRRNDKSSDVFINFNLEIIDIYTEMFDESRKNGEIKSDYGSRELAMFLTTMVNGIVYLAAILPNPDLKKLFEDNLNIVLDKITAK
ncbi:HTH-type transcriptional regulator BetI [Candidatus Methanobinarius endosymbioticus]|uniref:HTH-type transcriptional regulator BetI n=1 Tax=Candidatus Methanobinarius endosymbioticus TaxID=2006182 RepID=A0A366MDN1_9EURY|nr:HTH-type transcriptional regulator BetI [Candidatus Methanobinarius endosymbioticus]